jgi:hypothetical protein
MLRVVNENMRALNEAFAALTDTYTIACECYDTGCIATIQIGAEEYLKCAPSHADSSCVLATYSPTWSTSWPKPTNMLWSRSGHSRRCG